MNGQAGLDLPTDLFDKDTTGPASSCSFNVPPESYSGTGRKDSLENKLA